MNSKNTNLSRQLGSTLTGIIIGLVVGLGIAVIVALVITKASTPFTNKNGKSDKTDVPVTQMQDPNKPLFGSKEAVAIAAREVAASKAAETAKLAESKLDPKLDPNAVAAVGATPASQPANTVAAAPASGSATEDKYIYYLQAGAFKEVADAESTRAKLALIGVEATVTEKTSDTGTLHRVRVGPFDTSDAMTKMRAKLTENSVDTAIVKSGVKK